MTLRHREAKLAKSATRETADFQSYTQTQIDASIAAAGQVQKQLGYINNESVFALRLTVGESHIKVVRTVSSGGITYTAGHFALSNSNNTKLDATDNDWINRLTLTYGVPA